jgi:hypothetical protein
MNDEKTHTCIWCQSAMDPDLAMCGPCWEENLHKRDLRIKGLEALHPGEWELKGSIDAMRQVDLLRARVAELERDNKGWEDECRMFMGQRDRYREALRQIAADGVDHLACQVARNALDPGPESRGEVPNAEEV